MATPGRAGDGDALRDGDGSIDGVTDSEAGDGDGVRDALGLGSEPLTRAALDT